MIEHRIAAPKKREEEDMCFDTESAEFASNSTPKAIKRHSCDACGQAIEKGEIHTCCKGKYDGMFFTTRLCRRCEFDLCKIAAHELDEGCRWSEAWCPPSELHEYLCETDQKLTPKAEVPEWFDLRQDSAVAVERLRKNPTSEAASP